MEEITSRQNPRIVSLCKLYDRKYREERREFLLHGTKLYREAVACGVTLGGIFVTAAYLRENPSLAEKEGVVLVSDGVFEKLSAENAPQGIICSAKYIDFLHNFATIYNIGSGDASCFLAYEVRDPGNLGTVIRTANALGIDRLILSGCADLYNPKTVRAAMGGLFRQRITVTDDMSACIAALRRGGFSVYAAALRRDARRLDTMPQERKNCFLVGNEGHGLPDDLIAACDGTVFIPMQPETESLNAAVAASLLMWYSRNV